MADRSVFDLFAFLGQLSKRDIMAFDRLTDEGKKAAAPFVILRWMTGTSDRAQLVRLNTFCNRYMFALGQEKPLLFKLLAASATGSSSRYHWIKGPGSKVVKLRLEVIKSYFGVSAREAANYVTIEDSSIVEMAEELGWADDDVKKLKKAMTC